MPCYLEYTVADINSDVVEWQPLQCDIWLAENECQLLTKNIQHNECQLGTTHQHLVRAMHSDSGSNHHVPMDSRYSAQPILA